MVTTMGTAYHILKTEVASEEAIRIRSSLSAWKDPTLVSSAEIHTSNHTLNHTLTDDRGKEDDRLARSHVTAQSRVEEERTGDSCLNRSWEKSSSSVC
jgi:hypothetical protein